MLTKRERVHASIARKGFDAIPWQFDLTTAVIRKLERFVEGARRFLGVEGALPPGRGRSHEPSHDSHGLLTRSHQP